MPLRSKSVAIAPIRNRRTGTTSYRVTGTLKPGQKQRKAIFQNREDAEAQQALWEQERIVGNAGLRPKITFLTQSQLREAEAAFTLLKNTTHNLMDAVQHLLAHPPYQAPDITFQKILEDFLSARKAHLSTKQFSNYRISGTNFGEFIGWKTLLKNISSTDVTNWLTKKEVGKKTWNTYRNDIFAIFQWAIAEPRKYLEKNPVTAVERFRKQALMAQNRRILTPEQCRELMAFLEANHPAWCCFFAVTLFAGVRPDRMSGEMRELSKCVERDGITTYYNNGFLHLSPEITKEGDARKTTVHPNLAAWLEKYQPTPANLCPEDDVEYRLIRKEFNIPHDGLRHTAISAFVVKYGEIGFAAQEFGNSETIIKKHYLTRMSKENAEAFYAIKPSL